ncbi:hypothetical protein PoB_004368700 [Plakobranchus ocellatus]|uniref:Uncharacterized protein n=1 Tax=Plakobranchus ocellatus TaxID=259542 RepID=A0AAV4BCJ5_9GAST|nr:hypothetical protein PoB_004368700 [Plakobranchus ocellatus]
MDHLLSNYSIIERRATAKTRTFHRKRQYCLNTSNLHYLGGQHSHVLARRRETFGTRSTCTILEFNIATSLLGRKAPSVFNHVRCESFRLAESHKAHAGRAFKVNLSLESDCTGRSSERTRGRIAFGTTCF